MTKQNTLTTEQEVERIAKQIANGIGSSYGEGATYHGLTSTNNSHLDSGDYDLLVRDITTALIEDRNARAREVVKELSEIFDASENISARNCVLATAMRHGIDLLKVDSK